MKVENMNRVVNRMGDKWRWINNYNSDTTGRIVIGWDPNQYVVAKVQETNRVVHMKVTKCDSENT